MDDNWDNSAQLMGAICHFTGDSTQPLHSTWNYNPGGNHGAYETTALNAHIGEISIPDNYVPQELDNILAAALASLAKSFSYTREGANPGDNNLTDFLDNDNTWNDWIRSMTENRLRSAVQFTANIWYTAMIQAGLTIQAPTLTSPSDGSSTTDNTPTFTWTSVSGTSSYDFQLASDNNFTINVRTVKGLTTNSYTPVTSLTNGGWYWHVRTGDNSTDVGLWSQALHFTVAQATIVRGVQVSISPSSQENVNGGTLAYTVTVNNTGDVQENFQLEKGDNSGWTLALDNTWLLVPENENRATKLAVTIPTSATGCTWDNITVKATSKDNENVWDNKSCLAHVMVVRSVDVSISPSYQNGLPDENLTYTVTITNAGNVVDNYALTVSDNENWSPTLDNNRFDNVAPGQNRTTTLRVNIQENTVPGTDDNIFVTATSMENVDVKDNDSCIARATVWMGTATFNFENLYKLNLYKDNLWLYQGSKLVVKFYTYASVYQDESVIHVFTPPWQVVPENENVLYPPDKPVEIVRLVLTTDDTENEIPPTIGSFTATKSVLFKRYGDIKKEYPKPGADKPALFKEYGDLKKQYPKAP